MTEQTYRLLLTGSRHWADPDLIRAALVDAMMGWLPGVLPEQVVVAHGDAPGADQHGKVIAPELGMRQQPYPAKWRRYGKIAGPIRNSEMVEDGPYVLCLGFPLAKSRGTWDCLVKAHEAGIPFRVYGPALTPPAWARSTLAQAPLWEIDGRSSTGRAPDEGDPGSNPGGRPADGIGSWKDVQWLWT